LATTSPTPVLLAIAAGMGLFLRIVGIYGMIACTITRRRREVAIRVAWGAQHQ
jgi:hypothetical protein